MQALVPCSFLGSFRWRLQQVKPKATPSYGCQSLAASLPLNGLLNSTPNSVNNPFCSTFSAYPLNALFICWTTTDPASIGYIHCHRISINRSQKTQMVRRTLDTTGSDFLILQLKKLKLFILKSQLDEKRLLSQNIFHNITPIFCLK